MNKDVFDQMAEKWPSAVVARTEIDRFSGGLMSCKYLANLDSQGVGPARVVVGRKVAYPVRELVAWLRERSERR
jgi:hypothetical protein